MSKDPAYTSASPLGSGNNKLFAFTVQKTAPLSSNQLTDEAIANPAAVELWG